MMQIKINGLIGLTFGLLLAIFTITNSFAEPKDDLITYKSEKITYYQFFQVIKKQTGLTVFYNNQLLNDQAFIKVDFNSTRISDVINSILEGRNLTWSIDDKVIVLKKAPANIPAVKRAEVIKGVVVDENGVPLPGVSVSVKGTNFATVTNTNGEYSLNLPEIKGILVFRFLGFSTQEITINNKLINVILKEQATALNQVVVIGYGEVKRADLTGAVSSVKAEDLVKNTDLSLNQALQGRAAGIQVTSTEGAPGADVSITIRGGSSISASNEPLYVVDGFPQFGGSNLSINPADIASIEILKDASATAIYGARGANGVVIITTKSAQGGKFNINYTGYLNVQEIAKKLDVVSPLQYAEAQNYILSSPAGSGSDFLFANWPTYKDSAFIDWQDLVYREPIMQNHNLSFNGGAKEVKFSGSLGYTSQDGIALGTDFKRFTGRINAITNISKKLTNGTIIYLTHTDRNGPSLNGDAGIAYSILKASPFLPSDRLDTFLDDEVIGVGNSVVSNPIKELTERQSNFNTYGGTFNTYLQYALHPSLTFKVSGGAKFETRKSSNFFPSSVALGRTVNGLASISAVNVVDWLTESTLTYKKAFNKVHSLNAVVGFTAQNNIESSFYSGASDFGLQSLGFNNLELGEAGFVVRSNKQNYGLLSYLGRINYDYKKKYLLTFSLRADGSSKFQDDKWGYFPSGAFAWRLKDEKLFKELDFLSTLKFRASWGMTGNQSIPPYSSFTRYIAYKPILNESLSVALAPSNQLGNKDLRWETTVQSNLGLDFGVLKDRLLVTVDAYNKKSRDLLLAAPISLFSGYTSVFRNVGDIEVKGLELDLNTVNLRGNFNWNTNFNIAFNRSKVLALNEGQGFFTLGTLGRRSDQYIVQVGQPLGAMFGYIYDGVFNTQEELAAGPTQGTASTLGAKKYKDVNGPNGTPDGRIDQFDRTVIGNGNPKFFGGLSNDFTFKNFDFSFLLTYSYGNDVINSNKGLLERPTAYQGGLVAMMDRWTPQDPQVNMPKWGPVPTEFDVLTSYLVEDGSYVRLKNIQLGYTFPSALLKKLSIQSLKIYASAQNLFTLTKYTGYDPEVSFFNSIITPGADLGAYPRAKIYTLGINMNL